MEDHRIMQPLEKALRAYAVLALAIVAVQGLGLGMYLINVWPGIREGAGGLSATTTLVLAVATAMGFGRSVVWIKIYWDGSKALRLLRSELTTPHQHEALVSVLKNLTSLLIASCVLDVLFLPAYFLSDVVLPFPIAGWRLGVVELARIVFPQAFGVAALILAFLTHQTRCLVDERRRMKRELDLTI